MKLALKKVNEITTFDCKVIYFTDAAKSYHRINYGIQHFFSPLSFRGRNSNHSFARQWSMKAIRRLIVNPPDVIGLYGGYGRFTHTVSRICKFKNIPYYVHLGGWPVPRDASQMQCLNEATYVVTFTERQKKWMSEEGIYSGDNTRILPIGVDIEVFKPGVREELQRNPRLIYVGRLFENKGVYEAIQSVRAIRNCIPNITLDIIGSHNDKKFIKKLRNYIREYNLEEFVRLPGAVPYSQLPSLYANADLFIFPSPLESFGFAVVESMACGTPVIALRGSGGPEEIIRHGEDGILTDLPNLAFEAIELLQNPVRLKQMRVCAVKKIQKKYTLEDTVKKFKNLLEDLFKEVK